MTAKTSDYRMVKYKDPETGKIKFRKKRHDDEIVKQEDVKEKAVSKAQQKFFGMVRAKQKGEMPNASPEVKKAAASMSKKDVKDFAATKHKGLPAKKESAKIHHANAIGGSSMLHKEGYIGAKGEKGRDYHNAGTFDKDTAYSHAKKHNGVVHKDPSGKYLVKHGRGKHVSETLAAPAKPVTDKEIKRRQNISKTAKKNSPKTTMKGLRSRLAGESSDAYGKSQDAIANKKKHDAISQADRLKLAKLDALMKKQRKEETKYVVKYTHATDSKSGRTSGPLSKKAADKKAAMGNKVDKVGGKYTVIPHVENMDPKQKQKADLEEKNVPTNPKLWAKFKSQAKSKFDVYPSAYANGWAAKQYKAAGGSWKSKSEDVQEISTHKVKDYFKKAAADAANASRDSSRGDPDAASRQDKRNRGLKRALNRLKKTEATYQGKKVPLNKPMKGDVAKSKVYVDPDGDGKAKKVNFGDKNMTIKKHIPGRRKSFRARHNCDNPGPKDKARYWSCKAW